jgi:uncharacterized protein (DUF1778 family)
MNNALSRSQALPRRRSESRQRAALVAISLLPQARHMLAQKAQLRGVSLSEFVGSSAMLTASETNVGSLSR